MSKKKQTNPAKNRASVGKKISDELAAMLTDGKGYPLEAKIDRAIRAAVKKERARNVKILTRWQRSAASAGTVIGDHAAECIGACIEEIKL